MEEKEIDELWNSEEHDISEEVIEYSLKLLINRINLFEHEKSTRQKRRKMVFLSYIAAASILIAACVLFFLKSQTPQTYVADTIYSVPAGQSKKIMLADSTIVYLNSKSVLISPSQFISNERSVFLIGEAYFKVAKNKEKPFKVNTQLMTIEALGTEFSVLAYPHIDNVKTTLVEGKVKVGIVGKEASITSKILNPNQQAYYDPSLDEITVGNVNIDSYTSWIDGTFIFQNVPFAAVIERLEIQFDKKIEYKKALDKYRISAKFIHNESFDDILMLLSQITYSKVRKIDNTYHIK